ncbi:hypothetical protein GF360_02165 [candidate division WWE3 bacterium]|nr:hypothetical protein [candidate division WWE3 bacterium]
MLEKLVRKILVFGVDAFLFSVVFIGKLGSLHGVFQLFLFSFLFITLARAEKLANVSPNYFTHLYTPYKEISSKKEPLSADLNLTRFPEVTAKAVLVADLNSQKILYEKSADVRFAPASTTKLMTALVARDLYFPLRDDIYIPLKCAQTPGMELGLFAEEKISYIDLLNAALIGSANDAACTLANELTSEEEFVAAMNAKAEDLGLEDTHFTNPVGFDDANYLHYSSARNLYLLTLEARKDPVIKKLIRQKNYTLLTGDILRKATSTNKLLWEIPGTVGVKTGTTEEAGQVLIYEYDSAFDSSKGAVAKNGEKRNILIIVMGSEDRFKETEKILDWTLKRFVWL